MGLHQENKRHAARWGLLLLLAALAVGAAAARPAIAPRDRAAMDRAFAAGDTAVDVIVTLTPDSAVSSATRALQGRLRPSREDRRALHEKVGRLNAAVLAAAGAGEFTARHQYANFPGFSGQMTRRALERLAADERVAAIEPVLRLEPHLAQGLALMNANAARTQYRGQGMAIAICDTGIDTKHPVLGGGGFPNAKVLGGYDFGDNDADPRPNGQAHGTCCASIAAGDVAAVGDYVGGVAPDAKLYSLKISYGTGGSATSDAMIAAWDWCVTHQNDNPAYPIMVISTSFGGGRYYSTGDAASPGMTQAAANAVQAGITIFASSGNDGFTDSIAWPACISSVIPVGAVYDADLGNLYFSVGSDTPARRDAVTCYSNTASFLGLLAPSNNATTADLVGSAGYAAGDYYTAFGGTSAACPYAAGAAACLQAAAKALTGKYLTPAQVRTVLTQTGRAVTDGRVSITKPRIDLGAAIQSLVPAPTPTPTPTPVPGPKVTGIRRLTPAGPNTNAAQLIFVVQFDRVILGAGAANFTLTTTGGQQGAAIAGVSGTPNPMVYVTVNTDPSVSGGSIRLDLANPAGIRDEQGLPMAAGRIGDEVYTIDRQAPRIVSITRQNPPQALTNAAQLIYRVTFSEPVMSVSRGDFIAVGTGGQAGVTDFLGGANSGTVIDITVNAVAGAEGTVRLDLNTPNAITDLAGNALAGPFQGETYQVDLLPPRVLSIRRQVPAGALTNLATATWRVTLSEPVTGVQAGNFGLAASGGQGGATLSQVTPLDAATYDVSVKTVADAGGTIRLDLASCGAIRDLAGNLIVQTFQGGEAYTIDRVLPRLLSIRRQNPPGETAGGGTVTFRLAFSRAVQGVGAAACSLTASGGQAGVSIGGVATGDAQNYDLSVAAKDGASGRIGLNLTHPELIQDLLGNPLAGGRTGDEGYLIDQAPQAPSNLAPAAGQTGVSRTTSLAATAFFDPNPGDTPAAAEWQIRLSAGLPDYSAPVYSTLAATGDLTRLSLPPGVLTLATPYRWRVRQQDGWGLWSDWSGETEMITETGDYVPAPPDTPVNRYPAAGQTGVAAGATRLSGSDFKDADAGDSMTGAQWRLRTAGGSWSAPAFDSAAVAGAATRFVVPGGVLAPGTAYFWQVRYRDTRGLWSAWSAETSFTAGAGSPGAPDGLTASPGATSVLLGWPASPEAGVTGFNVYRAAGPGGPFTKLNSQPLTMLTWLDGALAPQQTWWYALSAQAGAVESPRSLPVAAVVGETTMRLGDLRGTPGAIVTQKIGMANPNGVSNDGLLLVLGYDAALLKPLAVRRTELTRNFALTDNHATAAGSLTLAGVGAGQLTQGAGDLFEIDWQIAAGAPLWSRSEIFFRRAELSDAQARTLGVDSSSRATVLVAATQEAARILGITRLDPPTSLTAAAEVTFRVAFSQNVNQVTASCFNVEGSGGQGGALGARVSGVSAARGATIDVTVRTGEGGDGTIQLVPAAGGAILNDAALPLDTTAPAGESYTIDRTAPRVLSIVRQSPGARVGNASSVIFRVTFSEAVRHIFPASFSLFATLGQQGDTVTSVSAGSGAWVDVAVRTRAGALGTVRLDLSDPGPIEDLNGLALAGAHAGDEDYAFDLPPDPPAPLDPPRGASGIALTPQLRAGTFFDPNLEDTQQAAQWQVREAAAATDYTSTVFGWTQTQAPFDRVTVIPGALAMGKSYAWRVRYQDGWGVWSVWSQEATFSTAPADPLTAPAGVTATASTSAITLGWDAHPWAGVTGYNIYRSAGNSVSYVKLTAAPLSATTYLDGAVQPGIVYYYTVKAVAGTRESGASDAVRGQLGAVKITMDDLAAGPGELTTQTLNVDLPGGIANAGLRVELLYDPALLTPLGVATTDLTAGFGLDTNLAGANGKLIITGQATGRLSGAAQGGAYLRVGWRVSPGAAIGAHGALSFSWVRFFTAAGTEMLVDATDGAALGVTGTKTIPRVVSINALSPAAGLTRAAQLTYRVTFSASVMNVAAACFKVSATDGQAGAAVTALSASQGAVIDVTVTTVNGGEGDVRLDLSGTGGIQDLSGNPLAGPRTGDQSHHVDRKAPVVVSINRWNPADAVAGAGPVTFRITFSEPVSGVSPANLKLVTTGSQGGAAIAGTGAGGATCDVTVNIAAAQAGTVRLDLSSGTGILDAAGNGLAATRGGDQVYTINQPPATPAALTPAAGAAGVALGAHLGCSAFSDPNAGDTHKASQWQLSRSAGVYDAPAYDSGATGGALTALDVPSGTLGYGTTYWWRVRQQDSHDSWSGWSAERSFTTEVNKAPQTPSNVTPAAGAVKVPWTPLLTASAFRDPNTGDRQRAAQWQVRLASSPSDYSQCALDTGETVSDLVSLAVPAGRLGRNVLCAWRVRQQDGGGLWSAWSAETLFTTSPNTAPRTPTNLAPAAGTANVALSPPPALRASAFSDADAGDTEQAAQWQVRSSASAADYSGAVLDSGATTADLTSLTLPAGRLASGTAYRWRVRQRDSGGDWSAWSAETEFSTATPPNTLGTLALAAGGFLGETAIDAGASELTVATGSTLSGTIQLSAVNRLDAGTAAPLALTADWGNRAAQVRTLSGTVAPGASLIPVDINTSAPQAAGDYHLLTVFGAAPDAAHLLSGTADGLPATWFDGNDAGFDWNAAMLAEAGRNGALQTMQLTPAGMQSRWMAAAVITLHVADPPRTPQPLAPLGGAQVAGLTPTLLAGAFADASPGGTQQAAQWQIRLAANPAESAPPVYDSGRQAGAMVSHGVPAGHLAAGLAYSWRVRYQNQRGVWSGWSAGAVFATPAPPAADRAPAAPVNMSPADGQGGVAPGAQLSASGFSDPDAGDTMSASQWRIRADEGDYAGPAFDSGVVDQASATYTLPASPPLAGGATFWWQARYRDAHGQWSPWSGETRFMTLAPPPATGGGTPAAPAAPGGFRAVAGARSVWLTWTLSSDPNVTGYQIYRATGAGQPLTRLTQARGSEAMDEGLTTGTTYAYALTAIRADQRESSPTQPVTLRVGTLPLRLSAVAGDPGTTVAQRISSDNPNRIANRGLSLTVHYDPAFLTPVEVRRSALTAAFTIQTNLGTGGGTLQITGSDSGAWISGEGDLFEIIYRVNGMAAYWSTSPITLVGGAAQDDRGAALTLQNAGPVLLTVKTPLITGDVDRDGRVTILDAVEQRRIILGQDPADLEQHVVGDLSGDGLIDSADQVLLLQALVAGAAGGTEAGARRTAQASGAANDALAAATGTTLRWGAKGKVGDLFTLPLTVDTMTGVAGMDLVINYDPSLLEVVSADRGSLLEDWAWSTLNQPGQLRIVASAPRAGLGGPVVIGQLVVRSLGPWRKMALWVACFKASGEQGVNLARGRTVNALDAALVKLPLAPVNVTPASGALVALQGWALRASAFEDESPLACHAASQWQVRLAADPPDYSRIVFDSGVAAPGATAMTLPTGVLGYGTSYGWRVRYQNDLGAWGPWSAETGFSTAASPRRAAANDWRRYE